MRSLGVLGLALAVGAMGCKSTSREDVVDASAIERPSIAVPTTEPVGGGPMSVAGALNVLASARCSRAESCGATHDRNTCERDVLQTHATDVLLLQCKDSVDTAKVERCAAKLRVMPCDKLEEGAAATCGAGKLCMKE